MEKVAAELAWPAVVLVSVTVFLFLFRQQIGTRITAVRKVALGKDRVFDFGEAGVDNPERPIKLPTVQVRDRINWQNTGNLYWIGHDLMWTMQMCLRGAPAARILYGIKHSLYHLRSLNLMTTEIGHFASTLLGEAQPLPDEKWDREARARFANKIELLINAVGKLAGGNQPDFERDVPPDYWT